jgi:pyruvate formate lyase activating enzyme
MSIEELMEIIERDALFYKASGGGLTISGGEPFLQKDFTDKLLRECKSRSISTAVESCVFVPWDNIETALNSIDYLYVDIKHSDSETHKKWTGGGTELILDNLSRIDTHEDNIELIVRIPYIPDFNAYKNNRVVRDIIEYAKKLRKLNRIEILPYHRLGIGKYEALGREYALKDCLPVRASSLAFLSGIGGEYGVELTIESK